MGWTGALKHVVYAAAARSVRPCSRGALQPESDLLRPAPRDAEQRRFRYKFVRYIKRKSAVSLSFDEGELRIVLNPR